MNALAIRQNAAYLQTQALNPSDKYNTLGYKILACVPLIGQIFNKIVLRKLNDELTNIPLTIANSKKCLDLTKLIKFYAKADLVQSACLISGLAIAAAVTTGAFIVSLIAVETFTFLIGIGILGIATSGINIDAKVRMLKNNALAEKDFEKLKQLA